MHKTQFVPFQTPPAPNSVKSGVSAGSAVSVKKIRPRDDAFHGIGQKDEKATCDYDMDAEFEAMSSDSLSGDGLGAVARFTPTAVATTTVAPAAKKARIGSETARASVSLPVPSPSQRVARTAVKAPTSLSLPAAAESKLAQRISAHSLGDAVLMLGKRFGCSSLPDVRIITTTCISESLYDASNSCLVFPVEKFSASRDDRFALIAVWLNASQKLVPWGFLPLNRGRLMMAPLVPENLRRKGIDAALNTLTTAAGAAAILKQMEECDLGVAVVRKDCFLCPYKELLKKHGIKAEESEEEETVEEEEEEAEVEPVSDGSL
jgi:hypothetical protein